MQTTVKRRKWGFGFGAKTVAQAESDIRESRKDMTKAENEFDVSRVDVSSAEMGREYIISKIVTNDEEMSRFLFSLGCFEGEPITLVSVLNGTYVVSIKDARYSIDKELAQAIRL